MNSKRFIPHHEVSVDVRERYFSIFGTYPKRIERYFCAFTRDYNANGYQPEAWSLKGIDACFVGVIKIRATVIGEVGGGFSNFVASVVVRLTPKDFSSVINTFGEILTCRPGALFPVGFQCDIVVPCTAIQFDLTKINADHAFKFSAQWDGYLCYGEREFNEAVVTTLPLYPYRQPI